MNGRRWLVVLACLLLLVGCGSTAPAPRVPDPLPPSSVSGAGAMRHLQALQDIADRNGGNRATPGPGYDASVDYVAGVLRAAGFQVDTPSYSQSRHSGARARNVVAQTRTGSTDHVVMLGAHLDSVREGPGINDDGSGVAALLEIATTLGDSPAIRNAVRFGFWGSEEDEMQGSADYVDSLSAVDRARIQVYLNADMVASPNAGYFVQGGVGDETSLSGPHGSAEAARVLADQLTATGVVPRTIEFDGESDFAAFIDAGIPSGGVLTGDEDEMTIGEAAQWHGQAGVDFDRCYHQACDGIGNINRVALDRYLDALAGTTSRFALSEGTLAH
jgi:aminopeptidase S